MGPMRRPQRWVWLGALLVAMATSTSVSTQQPASPASNDDPWVGSWRGTAALPTGETAQLLLTIVERGGGYSGVMSGFDAGTEVPFSSIRVEGEWLFAEATAESRFGNVVVRYELGQSDDGLTGVQQYVLGPQVAEFSVELSRRRRRDVPQPQVEQRLEYFLGEWEFEYTGGEFPPLSQGTRTAIVTFTSSGDGPFVTGMVRGDAWGEAYEESIVIGYDEATDALVFEETLWNGTELLSIGNWRSPIAIALLTRPVETDGQVYQLRRLFSMKSDASFMVTDEFSVDGGPFRRLGNGTYLKTER